MKVFGTILTLLKSNFFLWNAVFWTRMEVRGDSRFHPYLSRHGKRHGHRLDFQLLRSRVPRMRGNNFRKYQNLFLLLNQSHATGALNIAVAHTGLYA